MITLKPRRVLAPKIRKLAAAGGSPKAIAEKLKCPQHYVKAVLKRSPAKPQKGQRQRRNVEPLPEDAISERMARALGL